MTQIRAYVLPVEPQQLLTPVETQLFARYDMTVEYLMDFVLNHWMVFFEESPDRLTELVDAIFSERLTNRTIPGRSLSRDQIFQLLYQFEAELPGMVPVLQRVYTQLRPYMGTVPMDIPQYDSYIITAPHGDEMLVEIGVGDPSAGEH